MLNNDAEAMTFDSLTYKRRPVKLITNIYDRSRIECYQYKLLVLIKNYLSNKVFFFNKNCVRTRVCWLRHGKFNQYGI